MKKSLVCSHASKLLGGLLLGAAFAGLPVQGAILESNLSKAFNVTPGGQLTMDVEWGSIQLTTGERNEVVVEVKRKVRDATKAKAEELFGAHEVTFDQDGNHVSVRARFKQDLRKWFSRGPNLEVEYLVSLPKQFNLDLRTSLGSISCTDIEGTVKAKTESGSLKFARVKGPFEGASSLGSITLAGATGPVTAKTSSGSINLGEVESETTAETSLGSVTVKLAKARLKARSESGSIEVGEAAGPADLHTSLGSVRVKSAQARLDATTSSGSIEIADARDTVVAETSLGSIAAKISSQPQEDCRLVTSSGGITVKLDPELAFNVEAKTSTGKVSTELPVAATVVGEHKAHELKGKLNGGGKKLFLQTSLGSVAIRKL